MRLMAKIDPEYFKMLDTKTREFRQIESIDLVNSVTGESREFKVNDIKMCPRESAEHVKRIYSKVKWDPNLPVFSIELGDEIITKVDDSVNIENDHFVMGHTNDKGRRWYEVNE